MTTIAVVGAGFSGTLLTLHLLRRCPPPTRLVLIERNSQFGLGLAYATGNASHILNVPAGRMSAFHDRPNDFLDWLQTQPESETGGPVGFGTFAPRRVFGAYIRSLLNEEIKRSGRERLELVKGDVVGLDRDGAGLTLALDRDRVVQADMAVLAIGNFPPEPMPIADPGFYDTAFYRADPWAADALTELDPEGSVLLLGTGLTTVDAVISLLDQGHRGPIYALSRRGLLPRRHASVPLPAPEHQPFPTAVNALARFLRNETRRAIAQGSGWQPVIDELRPFTVDVWQTMPLRDRKRFLRHLRPWWDVHRHRMAAQVADRIDGAQASGQLRVLVGRVRDYVIAGNGVDVRYRPRRQEELARITVSRVVNCAGPGADYDRIQEKLIRHLLAEGVVRPDPLRLGLEVTQNCALLDREGCISRRLFAVGPVTKGTFWEMTAVPDIRRQAEKLAEYLAGLVNHAAPRPAA
ncbi:MAG TPA: FAD/NAD(P)-binding protein [Rhodopila sp.]|nr:FAD/NAD(P)-binding protein [Rhodopila sp.]